VPLPSKAGCPKMPKSKPAAIQIIVGKSSCF
jgi:hypothetical protein